MAEVSCSVHIYIYYVTMIVSDGRDVWRVDGAE